MKKIIYFSIQFVAITILGSGVSHAYPLKDMKVPLLPLQKLIVLARQGDVAAAEELAHRTVGADSENIHDNTLRDIASLLNAPSGSVRMWAAAATGNFGARAIGYAPRLQKMVSEEACNMTGLSSADTASAALQRMGIMPVPFGCR